VEGLELDVFGCVQKIAGLFCVIGRVEVDELERKGLEYLKAVHMVHRSLPSPPSQVKLMRSVHHSAQ